MDLFLVCLGFFMLNTLFLGMIAHKKSRDNSIIENNSAGSSGAGIYAEEEGSNNRLTCKR